MIYFMISDLQGAFSGVSLTENKLILYLIWFYLPPNRIVLSTRNTIMQLYLHLNNWYWVTFHTEAGLFRILLWKQKQTNTSARYNNLLSGDRKADINGANTVARFIHKINAKLFIYKIIKKHIHICMLSCHTYVPVAPSVGWIWPQQREPPSHLRPLLWQAEWDGLTSQGSLLYIK